MVWNHDSRHDRHLKELGGRHQSRKVQSTPMAGECFWPPITPDVLAISQEPQAGPAC